MISDEGQAVDSYKAATAALMGLGVFLGLLSLGGLYEIVAGNARLWLSFGVTREMLYWVTGGLAAVSLVLFAAAARRERRRDRDREARLASLETELAELLEDDDEKPRDEKTR